MTGWRAVSILGRFAICGAVAAILVLSLVLVLAGQDNAAVVCASYAIVSSVVIALIFWVRRPGDGGLF